MKTYAETLKEQMQAAGVTLAVVPGGAKPSEGAQDAIMSAEERSAIASDPDLGALRCKMIEGIFELQGKPDTPIRRQLREFGYFGWWLMFVVVFSFVFSIALTFPYYCYECATTPGHDCSDLPLPAFELLMLVGILGGIVFATWLAIHSRNTWQAYVKRVHNTPIADLLKEWKHQADLKIMRLEAARRRAEMDYLASRIASEMRKD